jgi:hypothetical protein
VVGHGPLRALLAPLFATLDAHLSAMNDDVGRGLLAAAWGRLPATLGRAKHNHLIAGHMLGGDVAWILEYVPEKVTILAQARDPHMALRQRAHTLLASLAAGLVCDVPALPLQQCLR